MSTRNERHGEWTDLLSEYLDGGLDADRHGQLEEHLSECGDCRGALDALRTISGDASRLGPIEPERDLWGGIAATIQAPPPAERRGATVIALPGAERADGELDRALGPTRFTLSGRQLLAASLVLVLASSLATWAIAGPAVTPLGPSASAAAVGDVQAVATGVSDAPVDLADELAALEQAVRGATSVLDPNTVRLLERNLGVIERAIEDSRRALALDPENDFLVEHLERSYARKLEYLRDAARVAERSG